MGRRSSLKIQRRKKVLSWIRFGPRLFGSLSLGPDSTVTELSQLLGLVNSFLEIYEGRTESHEQQFFVK